MLGVHFRIQEQDFGAMGGECTERGHGLGKPMQDVATAHDLELLVGQGIAVEGLVRHGCSQIEVRLLLRQAGDRATAIGKK